eukprot:7827287-Pyramimonas_sp.AAC.1
MVPMSDFGPVGHTCGVVLDRAARWRQLSRRFAAGRQARFGRRLSFSTPFNEHLRSRQLTRLAPAEVSEVALVISSA